MHAVGASASFGVLVIVCTFSSLLGGIAPVPGGMGVVEASYISLLTLLGIPEDVAIAATLLTASHHIPAPHLGLGQRSGGCGVTMNDDRRPWS